MSIRALAAAGAVAAGGVLFLSSPALAVVCDAYSGGCPPTPPGGAATPIDGSDQDPGSGEAPDGGTANPGGGTSTPSGGTSNPSTLPFTGGELILMTAIGAGALAGGTALVVAGRRRGSSPA